MTPIEFQKRLIEHGFDLPKWGADGSWGDETAAACADWFAAGTDLALPPDTTQSPPAEDRRILSMQGMELLQEREGCRLTAYQDSVGVWTIGYGHTSAAGPPPVTSGLKITQAEADAIFADDIAEFEKGIDQHLVGLSVEPCEFDAYVSLAYNIGLGGFAGSTTLRKYQEGDIPGAAEAILMWDKPPEIQSRRRAEHDQFLAIQFVARV